MSDTSVRELGKVLSGVGDAIETLNVSPQQREILRRLAACGGRQGYNQFNPLNWLVSPAYASDCSQTTIEDLMLGVKRDTLEKLLELCRELDPGVAAYAKATLATRTYADLPACECHRLRVKGPGSELNALHITRESPPLRFPLIKTAGHFSGRKAGPRPLRIHETDDQRPRASGHRKRGRTLQIRLPDAGCRDPSNRTQFGDKVLGGHLPAIALDRGQ